MTIYGTLVVALVQLLIIGIHSKFGFALAYCVIGFVEGVILVSTPALMRDFSPQMGRGAALSLIHISRPRCVCPPPCGVWSGRSGRWRH